MSSNSIGQFKDNKQLNELVEQQFRFRKMQVEIEQQVISPLERKLKGGKE